MRIGVMGTPGGDVGGTPHRTLTYPTGIPITLVENIANSEQSYDYRFW